MDITEELSKILHNHNGGAFLFIGSGFSRRYLNLEDWKGLLTRFCTDIQPFKFYETSASGNLAEAATLLANDFHQEWWKLDRYENNRRLYDNYLKDKTSALRVEISDYLMNIDLENSFYSNDSQLLQEIELLKQLNVNGIITTNWDLFLEKIFPEYSKFIGQKELLFAQLHGAFEIYKIHDSLVLTSEDYIEFEKKNSYLAAKLLTIFMEHPIIFIGYSLSDENIRNILTSIVRCVDVGNLDKLRKNLIFIQRLPKNETERIIDTSLNFIVDGENISLPITLIKTNEFIKVYQAIHQTHIDRFPVKLLQRIRKQIYELEFSDSPKERISVIEADKIDDYDEVEFVIGIGITKQLGISKIGYADIDFKDVFEDIILCDKNFDPYKLLKLTIFNKSSKTKYIPKFKYLKSLNINTQQEYENWKLENNIDLDKLVNLSIKDLQANDKNVRKSFERKGLNTVNDLVNESETNTNFLNTSLSYFPFLDLQNINEDDLEILKNFLIQHKNAYLNKVESSIYCTAFNKLIVLYDKLKYGW